METTQDIISKYVERQFLKNEMVKLINEMMPWSVDIEISRMKIQELFEKYKNVSDE